MRETEERYRLVFGTNLKFVAEFELHSAALLEALKSPGNSERGLPGLCRASKRGT